MAEFGQCFSGVGIDFTQVFPQIIDHMLKVHDALQICAPAISQKGAIAALKGPQKSVRDSVEILSKNREIMCDELNKLGEFVEYQRPMGAYYIMVKVRPDALRGRGKMNSFKLALKILREARVVTIPGPIIWEIF